MEPWNLLSVMTESKAGRRIKRHIEDATLVVTPFLSPLTSKHVSLAN